jgi:hypothetical protein
MSVTRDELVRPEGVGKDPVKRKAGLAGAKAKWRKVGKAERKRIMTAMARLPRGTKGRKRGPSPLKSRDRCPCGLMTRARAKKRNHRCEVPSELVQENEATMKVFGEALAEVVRGFSESLAAGPVSEAAAKPAPRVKIRAG